MLLQPRFFIYKRRQKQRKCISFKTRRELLTFGGAGLLLLSPVHLTANQLFRFKLYLKRASKKPDKTYRYVWISAFPHLPLTRKPNGIRMGKGKGKLEAWMTNISAGVTLFEFKNLRRGRTSFFMKQMTHKLGVPTKHLFSSNYTFRFPYLPSKQFKFHPFW